MVRTQLFLDEAMHARLRALARKQGRTVSELVREALARAFGPRPMDEQMRNWKAVEGLWRDRKDIGSTREYVRGLRGGTRRRRIMER
jgi:hypothetical protein